VCTNIRLAAVISVDKSDDESYTEPISNSIDNSADDSGLDSDFSLMSSKLGFKAVPTLPP
jgi:hypothetical protein